MVKPIQIGTRDSQLALAQAEWVSLQLIQAKIPNQIVPIKTEADQNLEKALHQFDAKGVFIKELEQALLEGKIDLAVHSAKDLPSEITDQLEVPYFCAPESAQDLLVLNADRYLKLPDFIENIPLPKEARVATGSLRRTAQLKRIRPDLQIHPLRGNILTRLRKLKDFDAIVLAQAGLQRLKLMSQHLVYPLPVEVMLPAVGQGVLAIQINAANQHLKNQLSFLDQPKVSMRLKIERKFLNLMQGGCQVPLGCYAEIENDQVCITGFVGTRDGKNHLLKKVNGSVSVGDQLADQLAAQIMVAGGSKILEAEKSRPL